MNQLTTLVKNLSDGLSQALDPITSDPISFAFYFLTELEANKRIDKETGYFFLLEAPLTSKRVVGIGTVDAHYPLRIFIGKRSKLQASQEQRQDVIDAIETAVNEFVLNASLDDSGLILIGDANSNEVHNDFDLNADGWYLNVTVKLEDVIDC